MKNAIARVIFSTVVAAGFSLNAAQTQLPKPQVPQKSTIPVSKGIVVAQSQSGFRNWVAGFRNKALSRGISSRVFDLAFAGVKLNQRVMKLDRKQAEFSRKIWDYMDTATSPKRVKNGRAALRKNRKTLAAIQRVYGVDAKIVTSIWGLESTYGERMGDIRVIEALATLAYEGRRRKFGEEQLMEALRILQKGDISSKRMLGSWAGAMGHTQFIPTSYSAYAQDFRGDGRRDIWDPRNPTDALASTANYLKRHGWRKGHPWGLEVRLPAGFSMGNASHKLKRPASRWNQLGVRLVNGKKIPNYGDGAIFAPAGAKGPAFVVFKNFYVIKRYNNADSYAMAVGHLADRIAGSNPFSQPWPRGRGELNLTQKIEMQKRLTRKGFDTQGADGMIGPNTVEAIKKFQRSRGLKPNGKANATLLNKLR